jgi:hypothetical protein
LLSPCRSSVRLRTVSCVLSGLCIGAGLRFEGARLRRAVVVCDIEGRAAAGVSAARAAAVLRFQAGCGG